MKIRITFKLSEQDRLAIAHHYGRLGVAEGYLCRTVIESLVEADLETLRADFEKSKESKP